MYRGKIKDEQTLSVQKYYNLLKYSNISVFLSGWLSGVVTLAIITSCCKGCTTCSRN